MSAELLAKLRGYFAPDNDEEDHAAIRALMCGAADEIERLAHTLHRHHAHPDYEYETTKTGRKTGESLRPVGEGWEPNDIVEIESYKDGVVVGTSTWRAWDRFEFHEEEYWRRRIRP